MTPRRITATLTILALCLTVGGCQDEPPPVRPILLSWQEISLPAPSAGERLAVRGAAACGGRWYLTGAIVAADGATRPAAWTSENGRTWSAMTLAPKTYYGRQNTLYTAGCRDGRLAAVGAQTGGAHGNPRTSSWFHGADGVLTEVIAGYTLFGGPKAVNVSRIAGGPRGWMIVGNRLSGAAAWVSRDAAEFRIVEGAPGLASDARGETWDADVVAAAGVWTIVGGFGPTGRIDRDPAVWTSSDGLTWQRVEVSGDSEYEEMQRVAMAGETITAIGLRGATFGTWRTEGGTWTASGRFGSAGGRGLGFARDLVYAGGSLFAATSDGATYSLWESRDVGASWRAVATPVPAPSGAARAVVITSAGPALVLTVDDGRATKIWTATVGRTN